MLRGVATILQALDTTWLKFRLFAQATLKGRPEPEFQKVLAILEFDILVLLPDLRRFFGNHKEAITAEKVDPEYFRRLLPDNLQAIQFDAAVIDKLVLFGRVFQSLLLDLDNCTLE